MLGAYHFELELRKLRTMGEGSIGDNDYVRGIVTCTRCYRHAADWFGNWVKTACGKG